VAVRSRNNGRIHASHPKMNLILVSHAEAARATATAESSSSLSISSSTTTTTTPENEYSIDLPPNDERMRHIVGHLNKVTGDDVHVGFVDPITGGYKCRATVMRTDDGGVKLVRVPGTIVMSVPMPEITLVLAVPFPSRMRYLWPLISAFAYVTRVIIVKSKLSDGEYMKSSALSSRVYGPMIARGMSQGRVRWRWKYATRTRR
jgi:hypothetical protein